MRFLYEPVTVNGELEAMRICAVTGNRREGSLKRAEIPRTHKPGNLPVISAGMFLSQDHADLVALSQVVPDGFFLMEKFPKETAAFTRLKTSPAQRPIYSMEAFFSVKMSADAGIYASPGTRKLYYRDSIMRILSLIRMVGQSLCRNCRHTKNLNRRTQ